jgi:hypothetical protein
MENQTLKDSPAGYACNCFLAQEGLYVGVMTAIAERLSQKLEGWSPEKAAQVEQLVAEIIELADADAVDLLPSRQVTQEVLDLLDEGQAG